MATTNIYILALENGYYYIGKSDNIQRRFSDHLNGHGSFWTKKHKPLHIIIEHLNVSPFDEDKYVKEYMSRYGIDKVRGGSYVTDELTSEQINILTHEIRNATDVCIKCGLKGHFAKNCHKQNKCYRCNRNNHLYADCHALTDINGVKLDINSDKNKDNSSFTPLSKDENEEIETKQIFNCKYCNREFNSSRGCRYHENLYCKEKQDPCIECCTALFNCLTKFTSN